MARIRSKVIAATAFRGQVRRPPCAAILLAAILTIAMSARTLAGNPTLTIELNKLEPHDKGCRVFLVIDNATESKFETLKFDLIFFRPDGVIDRRLALDVSPIYPKKKSVKTFDLDSIACEGIGTVLLNEVMDCRSGSGDSPSDCLANVTLSSRAAAHFEK